jgi:protease-4
LPEALAVLVGRSVAGVLYHADQSMRGVSALWLGDYRF